MSFGGENVSKVTLKNFESQEEIDEKKRRRQEEWEKVRKPDDPLGKYSSIFLFICALS